MTQLLIVSFAIYMAAAALSYAVLVLLSLRADRKYHAGAAARQRQLDALHIHAPAVTLLAPAKNEELIISESVKIFLALPYPNLSLVIVDDGSTDRTFQILHDEFCLVPSPEPLPLETLRHQPIISVWKSATHPPLTVLKKLASRASKGDANNAGLEVIQTPLVFTTDVDSILEPHTISRMVVRMQETGAVAVGCPLRPLNGVRVVDGMVIQPSLPHTYWELSQVAEYERAFQLRQGWDYLGMLNNISGAAGLFQVAALREIGGYRPDTTAEDLASTFSFHLCNQKIALEPGVNVFTQVPESMKSLRSQRKRWARGLIDNLWYYRTLLNPLRHGRLSLLPLWLGLFEMAEPFIETAGLAVILALAIAGDVPLRGWLTLLSGLVFSTALSAICIYQRHRLYPRLSSQDAVKLACFSILEITPLKIPLSLLWRMLGTIEYLSGDTSWEPLPRQTFSEESKTCAIS